MVLCFQKDDSSTAWTMELRHMIHPRLAPYMREWRSLKVLKVWVNVATMFIYFFLIAYRGVTVGFLIVLWTMVGTMVLPCFLARLSHQLALDDASVQNPNPDEDALTFVLDTCRAFRPLILGMHCGLCVSVFGFLPCLDAALLFMTLFAALDRMRGAKQELSLEKFVVVFSFRGTIMAASAYSNMSDSGIWLVFFEAIVTALKCIALSFTVGAFLVGLYKIGTYLGESAYSKAKASAGAGMLGLRQLQHDSVGAGVVAFSIWVVSLFLLIVT